MREALFLLTPSMALMDAWMMLHQMGHYDDFNHKLASLSTQLPRQARWEIDRQRRELTDTMTSMDVRPLAERTVSSLEHVSAAVDRLVPSVEGAARTAERTPDILATERRAAVDAVNTDLNRTIVFAQQERLSALLYLTNERKAMVDDLRKAIGGERVALGSEIDQMSVRMVDHAMDRMERFVWQVLGALSGAVVAFIVLVRVLFGRRAVPERQLV